jgi:hypothetical protein
MGRPPSDRPPKPAAWMHQLGSVADPSRERSGHDLVIGLYRAMSDLGFDPAIDSPPSEQKIAAAKRATNALLSSALKKMPRATRVWRHTHSATSVQKRAPLVNAAFRPDPGSLRRFDLRAAPSAVK